MKTKRNLRNIELLRKHSDGILKSRELALILGETAKYVQDLWRRNPDIPRPLQAPPLGECNPSFVSGKIIDLDGYVLVLSSSPDRLRKDRNYGRILEHRKVIEDHLGRKLKRSEVVHHKNGCKIDNRFENLEVCQSNGEHLKMELSGHSPNWTIEGEKNFGRYWNEAHERIDTYRLLKKNGVIRAQQILLAQSLLGKDYLSLYKMERYLTPKLLQICNEIKQRMDNESRLSFFDLKELLSQN